MAHTKTFFFAILFIAAVAAAFASIPTAYAEIEKGKTYNREFVGLTQDGRETYQIVMGYPERIYDGNSYEDYILYEDAGTVRLETANSGSFIFDKNACSYNLYDSGYIGSTMPKIKDISWTVKGKLATNTAWSNVNTINNAACSVTIYGTESTVQVVGSKTSGAGTFQIVLDYVPGQGIKETMRAYNNNPAWTNHNIGFTEKFQVPRIIHLGNQTYDLSEHDGLVLGRNWIGNNTEKLIKLSDRIFYDFGIGWESLDNLQVSWDGSKAFLSLNYLYPTVTVPYQQWFEVDPTFTSNAPTESGDIRSNAAVGAACPTASYSKSIAAATAFVGVESSGVVGSCYRYYAQYDTTTIPNGAAISSVTFNFTVTAIAAGPRNGDFMPITAKPSTATAAAVFTDIGDGTAYVTNSTTTATTGAKTVPLGNSAATDLYNLLSSDWFAVGIKSVSEVRDATERYTTIGTGNHGTPSSRPFLIVVYTIGPPYAITTLQADDFDADSVDLSWNAPVLNGGTLQLYQMNYTTPCGTPLTALPNGTTATSYTVSGLTGATCYSFRATAVTDLGKNITGANIVNVTTDAFNEANYTIGSFNFQATNQNIFPIRYERIDNGTQTLVNVTFTNSFNLACDLRYTYAQTNQTYYSISSIPVSASEDEASFNFLNSTNDIVTFHCWNQAGNQSANYVMTQTDFLLKQQVRDFRNGTYGTMGQFGAFDFITLIVVIIAMIGLNHKSEAVGGFFAIIAVAVLAYFEIVAWYTAIIAGLAVIILLAISSTRKD